MFRCAGALLSWHGWISSCPRKQWMNSFFVTSVLPIKLSVSQPTSFFVFTLLILSPIPPRENERCVGLGCQLRLNPWKVEIIYKSCFTNPRCQRGLLELLHIFTILYMHTNTFNISKFSYHTIFWFSDFNSVECILFCILSLFPKPNKPCIF